MYVFYPKQELDPLGFFSAVLLAVREVQWNIDL